MYDVSEAGSGTEALERIRDAAPDLVILDVHLPDVSGIEICARLKDDEALRHIPVVLLTAADHEWEQAAGLAAGAAHYITKPFSPLRLVDVVRRLLPH
jgi:CheY-like chemotaxis protein